MFKKNKKNKGSNEQKTSVFQSSDFQSENKLVESQENILDDLNSSTSTTQTSTTSNSPNDVFFEKFEKSKKDFIKEKKKEKNLAKKTISNKNKLLGFESKLRDEEYFKKFWIILLTTTGFVLAYACVVIGLLGTHFFGPSSTSKWIASYNLYQGVFRTSIVFSGVIICLIPLPYIFLLSAWFIGINNVHRSKVFVISNLSILAFCVFLLFLTIILSSIIFGTTVPYRPVTS